MRNFKPIILLTLSSAAFGAGDLVSSSKTLPTTVEAQNLQITRGASKVRAGFLLNPGDLHFQICKTVLEGPVKDSNLPAQGAPKVRVVSETFLDASGVSGRVGASSDMQMQVIKQALMASRVKSGGVYYASKDYFPNPETAPDMPSSGRLLHSNAYDALIELTSEVHFAGQIIPVTIKEVPAQILSNGNRRIMVPAAWEMEVHDPRSISPVLLNANIGDGHVTLLSGAKFEALPSEIRDSILSYDLWKESLLLPHSIGSYEKYIDTTSGKFKSLGSQVFSVTDSGGVVGFIEVALFASHIETPLYLGGTEIHNAIYSYELRFDGNGMRVDIPSQLKEVKSQIFFDSMGLSGMANLHR